MKKLLREIRRKLSIFQGLGFKASLHTRCKLSIFQGLGFKASLHTDSDDNAARYDHRDEIKR